MQSIFIAGPMTGHAQFNHPAFDAAEAEVRRLGYPIIFNPAAMDRKNGHDFSAATGTVEELKAAGFNRAATMIDNTAWIAEDADAVVVLDGWRQSRGACAEVAMANAMGKPVYALDDGQLVPEFAGIIPSPSFETPPLPTADSNVVDGPWPFDDDSPFDARGELVGQQSLEVSA